jgi:hypothetical protein
MRIGEGRGREAGRMAEGGSGGSSGASRTQRASRKRRSVRPPPRAYDANVARVQRRRQPCDLHPVPTTQTSHASRGEAIRATFTPSPRRKRRTRPAARRSVQPSPRPHDANVARVPRRGDPCNLHRVPASQTSHASRDEAIRATFTACPRRERDIRPAGAAIRATFTASPRREHRSLFLRDALILQRHQGPLRVSPALAWSEDPRRARDGRTTTGARRRGIAISPQPAPHAPVRMSPARTSPPPASAAPQTHPRSLPA